MLHSSELDSLPEERRYFALTFAYMDSTIALCRDLCAHGVPRTFASSCPMLWLARQATELFYKACLFATLGAIPEPPKKLNMHNLVFYQNEFRKHFPEDAHPFDPPVSESLVGGDWNPDKIDQFLKDANLSHQRHRYPTDSRGNDFPDLQGVTPETMIEELRQSRDQMVVIAQRAMMTQEPETNGDGMMCNPNQYDLALSFWTVSFEYLMLVENVARETVAQGNTWFMTKDWEDGEITDDEYAEGTRWSDHTLVIPLLFNLYHGIELLAKGFLLAAPNQNVKPRHNISRLCRQFSRKYPNENELIDFFTRFTDEQRLPALLANFLKDNSLTLNDLYQAVRYPSDQDFQTLRKYVELKYQGEDGLLFFQELVDDIKAIRVAAVRLGRSLEPTPESGQQNGSTVPAGPTAP